MKISNSGYITKGIVLLISGILIGFFPSVITWIFYIIGGIVIVSSVFTLIGFSGDGSGGGIGLAGIIIGAIIMLIPKILTVGIAIVGGAIFTIYGISMLVKALRSDKSKNTRIIAIVFSILLTAFGIFMLVSPFKGGVFAVSEGMLWDDWSGIKWLNGEAYLLQNGQWYSNVNRVFFEGANAILIRGGMVDHDATSYTEDGVTYTVINGIIQNYK